jgi:hypothetical protein
VGSKSSTKKLSWPVLLALAVNLSLALSYIGLWFIAARDELLWRADFSAFYTGGALVRNGLGSQLYDLDLQTKYQQEILGGRSFSQNVLPYNYPPHLALLFAPLTLLPLAQAFFVWTFIQLLLLAILVFLLIRITDHWSSSERLLAIIACLALPGMLRNFLLGAFSLWMLLCLLGWYFELRRGADGQAAAWFLLGSAKPQIMVGPGLVFLMGQRWKSLILVILGGLVIFAVTGLIFGWQIWLDFLERLIASGNYYNEYGITPAGMYNFKGTLTLRFGSDWAKQINLISLAGFLFSLVLTVFLWRGKWDAQKPGFVLRLSFTLFLGLFFSLHVNLQDGLLLAAPLLLFYEYLRLKDLPRKMFAILALSCPTLLLLDEFFFSDWLPVRLAVVLMVTMLIWSGMLLRAENHQLIAERNLPVNIDG